MSRSNWQHRTLGAVRDVPPELLAHLSALSIAKRYNYAYWRDHEKSLVGINPVGPADAPAADQNGEGWLYAGVTTDNVGVIGTQVNHDCVNGLEVVLVPHVHWRKTSDADGDVVWKCEYKYAAPGGKFGNYVQAGSNQKTPIQVTIDDDDDATHLITSFGPVIVPIELSTMIFWKLTRVASDTVNDTYNGNALAMSFDFHYPSDSPGSYEEYSKGAAP